MSRPYRANSFLVLFSGRCPELVCLALSGHWSLAFLICRKMAESRQNIRICQLSSGYKALSGQVSLVANPLATVRKNKKFKQLSS